MLNLTKEFLYQRYIIDNQTIQGISDETGYTNSKIKGRLRRFGIRKHRLKLGDQIYDNKDWLYDQYIVQQKGYTVIANELDVSYTTILDRILFFGWELRGHNAIDKGAPSRGKKRSDISIQKIRDSRIKNRIIFNCPNCEEEIEKVVSVYNKSQKSFCNRACYKDFLKKNRIETEDITDSAEYKEWRKKVYLRDNYKCKMPGCTSISKQIAAHHIYPKKKYPEKQFDLSNGITLCKKCHETTFGKETNFIDALVRVIQKMND
ncbi:HNH endonuclease [Bacillus sp. OK048]|uniref:HNH endonuclease n=1 Tax=Bacillus sp. OK048 TaxID=1882761 RepID=UPI00088C9B49|nr:HNH endonuclease signature motif containing protein [Bacillus sp. OK048]SDM16250.1 HNH endonuclease [Bacillus sp. OK048]